MTSVPATTDRPVWPAIVNGLKCRCPQCGEGKLFQSFLKPVDVCQRCDEPMDGHRSDDLPPYITIFIVGHVIVPLVLAVEMSRNPWPMWVQFSVWLPLTLLMTMLIMQPVKGAVIALQWAKRLHGFDPAGDIHAQLTPPVSRPTPVGRQPE
jgi:uncharacterized protein (DUF983 family)